MSQQMFISGEDQHDDQPECRLELSEYLESFLPDLSESQGAKGMLDFSWLGY